MDESELISLSPARLRYDEAGYFYEQFVVNCGPPVSSSFKMICYFDSFLFSLISVEGMVNEVGKDGLWNDNAYRFLKALRNITSHHAVLAAVLAQNKYPRPFYEDHTIYAGQAGQPGEGGSSRLRLRFDVLKSIFDEHEKERPSDKHTINAARDYIAELEQRGEEYIYIEDVMSEGLDIVKTVLDDIEQSDEE